MSRFGGKLRVSMRARMNVPQWVRKGKTMADTNGWRVQVHKRVGDLVYVAARNCRMLADSVWAGGVRMILQPGDSVIWRGTDTHDRAFASVEKGGTSGVILYSSLSTTMPDMTIHPSTGPRSRNTSAFMPGGWGGSKA